MKTEVVMRRELFGEVIQQKSKSEMLSATDLVRAGNKWRVNNGLPFFNLHAYMQNKTTKEFIVELEKQFGQIKINSKGKNGNTWVHPFLFIDIALAISPDLKIEVYSWIYDHLLRYRNDSGESYKKMAGALYLKSTNKTEFPMLIKKTANEIKIECNTEDWEQATENQLKLRDRIHENIALLADILPIEEAIRIGIKKAKENN